MHVINNSCSNGNKGALGSLDSYIKKAMVVKDEGCSLRWTRWALVSTKSKIGNRKSACD